MPRELEALPGHLINIGQNLLLVAGSKITHIQNIFANHPLNLLFEFRGCVYWQVVSGVRKSVIIKPFRGLGGYVPGTPMTMERFPLRERMSQSRSSLIASELAMEYRS